MRFRSAPQWRAVGAVLLLAQAACMTAPRPVNQAPGLFLRAESPKRIWVRLASGEQLVIDGPTLYGDSLLGIAHRGTEREEIWLPVSDLQEVRTRHVSGPRTALLGGVIAGLVGFVVISIPTEGGPVVRPCMNEGEPCESA